LQFNVKQLAHVVKSYSAGSRSLQNTLSFKSLTVGI